MSDIESIVVDKKEVSCDGGKMGHPKVYLNLGEKKEIVCPYCSKKFIIKSKD